MVLRPVRAALARLTLPANGSAALRAGSGDDHLPIDAALMPLDLAEIRLPRLADAVGSAAAVALARKSDADRVWSRAA